MIERKTVSQCISSDYCKGWNDAVDAMPGWIRVEEMLPRDGIDVIVYTDRCGGNVEYAYYLFKRNAWFKNCILLVYNVTHWMPLPEPPKGE